MAVLAQDEEHIREKLLQTEVVHYDETGFYVGKDRYWEYVASNEFYTSLSVHSQRGAAAIPIKERSRVLQKYRDLLKQADKEEPPPIRGPQGKPGKSKGQNLPWLLIKHQDSVELSLFIRRYSGMSGCGRVTSYIQRLGGKPMPGIPGILPMGILAN